MATINPRLNITCESELLTTLTRIAAKNNKSLSMMARELLLLAIDKNEDLFLSDLAAKRDQKNTKTISHKKAWN